MSAFIFHVTFDCADPERMASLWGAVTGYERLRESTEDVVAFGPTGRRLASSPAGSPNSPTDSPDAEYQLP